MNASTTSKKCLAHQTGELSRHYNFNDIVFLDEVEPVTQYPAWWTDNRAQRSNVQRDDDREKTRSGPQHLTDVSLTTGVINQFIVGDFIKIGQTGPLTGNGRYIDGRCRYPRDTGKVNITIETNP